MFGRSLSGVPRAAQPGSRLVPTSLPREVAFGSDRFQPRDQVHPGELPAGHAHVPRHRRPVVPPVDNEIMPLRLAADRFQDRRIQLGIRSAGPHHRAQIRPHHPARGTGQHRVPVQVSRTRLQFSQKLCAIRRKEPERAGRSPPRRNTAPAHRCDTRLGQRPAQLQPRLHHRQR